MLLSFNNEHNDWQKKKEKEEIQKQKEREQLEVANPNGVPPETTKKVRLGPDGKPKEGRGKRQREKKRLEKAIKEGKIKPEDVVKPPTTDAKVAKSKDPEIPGLAFSQPKAQAPVALKQPTKKELTRKEKAQILKRKKSSPFFFTPEDGSQPGPAKRRKIEHKRPQNQKSAKERDFESLVSSYKDIIGKPTKKWDEL